jgi:hypothetical protein
MVPRKRGVEAGKKPLFTRLSTIIVDNLMALARQVQRICFIERHFAEREWV